MNAGPSRVLVVDDDQGLMEAYADLLGDAGFETETAASAAAAAERLSGGRFDLVLTDMVLPDASGLEVMNAARREGLDVPIVFVTGYPTLDTAIAAVEGGAARYLPKPVSADDLLRAADEVVRLHRERSRERETRARAAAARARLEAAFQSALASVETACEPIVRVGDGSRYAYAGVVSARCAGLPSWTAITRAAERLGRLADLGRVVRRSAAGVKRLSARGLPLFVVVHPDEIEGGDLLDADEPLLPHASEIVLDITGRIPPAAGPRLAPRLQALRAAGYRVAVEERWLGSGGGDGFPGPVDFVRLAPETVKNLTHDPLRQALVAAAVAAAADRGAEVLASGALTPELQAALGTLACPLLQACAAGEPRDAIGVGPTAQIPGATRFATLLRRFSGGN